MKFSLLLKTIPFGAMLLLAGCSNSGVSWGEEAGGGGGGMRGAAGMTSGEKAATGGVSMQLAGATVEIIAKHEATEQQRQIATQHARTYLKAHPPRSKKRRHRYLAVDTARDSRTSPQAQKVVIIFDTEAQQVVGKNVYDVQTAPALESVARFETYSAEYVGSGQ